jgi:orotate phosphoribosyltransferase
MTDASLAGVSVESLFERSGALLDGHFLLKSGRHAGRYLEKFLVLQHPAIGVELCRRFAEALAPYRPTLVVGPRPAASCCRSRRPGSSAARSVRHSPSR